MGHIFLDLDLWFQTAHRVEAAGAARVAYHSGSTWKHLAVGSQASGVGADHCAHLAVHHVKHGFLLGCGGGVEVHDHYRCLGLGFCRQLWKNKERVVQMSALEARVPQDVDYGNLLVAHGVDAPSPARAVVWEVYWAQVPGGLGQVLYNIFLEEDLLSRCKDIDAKLPQIDGVGLAYAETAGGPFACSNHKVQSILFL